MSRFLSSYRRLEKKLSAMEARAGISDLGEAMRSYALTGELPEHPGAKETLLRYIAGGKIMLATLPGPGPETGEPCLCGVCEECQSAKPVQEWKPGQLVPGSDSGRGR
jgi:hypothetical protein